MKQIVIIILSVIFFSSCVKEQQTLSAKEIQVKADSIVATRIDELNRQYQEDLDQRMAIEVKPKADSIVRAIQMKADSASKK